MFQGLWFFCKFGWKTDPRYILYHVLNQFLLAVIPLLNIIMPKFIIDTLLGSGSIPHLAFYVCVLTAVNFLASSLSHWLFLSAFTLRTKIAAAFDEMMHQKLANADFETLESPGFLDMKEKANKFLYGDWQGFAYVFDSALQIIGQIFILAGIIAIVASLDLRLVVLFMALVAASTGIEAWAKKNDLALSLEQAKVERAWGYFGDLFENFSYGKEIRINSMGDWLLRREKQFSETALSYYRRRNGFYIKSGFCSALASLLQQGAAYCYLVWQVLAKCISIGDFSMYISAVASFSDAMKTVMDSIVSVKAYGIYYDAMRDYLNVPETIRSSGSRMIRDQQHTIEFRDVSFRYKGQQAYALRHVNLVLHQGDTLSVVGENGAGKTTFIKLLTRLYDPTQGEILLDGIDIRHYAYESYAALFSAVFQDFQLFSFSIKENVCLNRPAPDSEVQALLRKVGLGEKLDSLPRGIHTSVYKNFDEDGFEPSGGEGQKIALARALYKNAPFVILDEPTAALDPKAEYELYQKFHELVQNKTAVYISHRLSSAKFCKKIAVFEHGAITEVGTHEELLQKDGTYAKLFRMQAQFYT